MREQGLAGRRRRRFKCTTDSKHALPIAPNLLNRDFTAQRPNTAWVGDTTFVWTHEGWLYLAAILDLFSRRVVGWAMSEHNDSDLVLRALQMAIAPRQPPPGLIFHSDRVESAQLTAELSAHCLAAEPNVDRASLAREAIRMTLTGQLKHLTQLSVASAQGQEPYSQEQFGNTGFAMHSLCLTLYVFVRWGNDPVVAITQAILLGGDTDTNAAIVGAWCGALHGERALPLALVAKIHDGPFGPTHLRALADALALRHRAPVYNWHSALLRNLILYPVVLAHGFARLGTALLEVAAARLRR